MQSLPLEVKILKSQQRIREWYEHWNGMVYVSFSGGKDSTVLLHLVREMYPDVPAVFINTGLEYPENVYFARTIDNLVQVRPKYNFKQIIEKYGYPVVSKEQSQYIYEYRNTKSKKLKRKRFYGVNGNWMISRKWRHLLKAPFPISDHCCQILKKNPVSEYERETGRKGFIGNMAGESRVRAQTWLSQGCNAFDANRPISRPMSFWTDKDVWDYIGNRDVSYSRIYDMGYTRTGCVACCFGVHLEGNPNRFQLLEKTHPKFHRFCIERLGVGEVLDYMGIDYYYRGEQGSLFNTFNKCNTGVV